MEWRDERNCVWCFTPATGFDRHAHWRNKWLTREQTSGVQQQIRQALSALPLPVNRLEEFITAVRRGVNVRPG
ncbi:hypothetical protein ACLB1M_09735 [Escherichia coli]